MKNQPRALYLRKKHARETCFRTASGPPIIRMQTRANFTQEEVKGLRTFSDSRFSKPGAIQPALPGLSVSMNDPSGRRGAKAAQAETGQLRAAGLSNHPRQ